ncbi:MAG: DUF5329 domain-containing protein [Rhodanobacter sp.]
MRILVAFLLALLCAAPLSATPLAPTTRTEIDTLLTRMQSSACEFNRNGSWYTAAEAKTHLLRKLDYLDDKGAVHSTEQFIELAASRSSLSGQTYQVKCGDAAAVESRQWLLEKLWAIRAR